MTEEDISAVDTEILQLRAVARGLARGMDESTPPNFRSHTSDYIERMLDVISQIEVLERRKESMEKSLSTHSTNIIEKWLNG